MKHGGSLESQPVGDFLQGELGLQVMETAPKVPMYRPRTAEPRFLTRTEFARLVLELPTHLKLAARFAVLTGLRMRSMLALEWSRIDMKGRRAWIPGEQMKAGRALGMPLSNAAVGVLKELRKLSPHGEHVFQWKGQPVDDCNGHAFKDAAKRAGLPDLRWRDLRRTWASWAVQSGVMLQELMQLGGWSSYTVVLRYAHLAPDHMAAAAEKVTEMPHKNRHGKDPRQKRERKSLNIGGKGGGRTLMVTG